MTAPLADRERRRTGRRLAVLATTTIAVLGLGATASFGAIGNRYSDGQDLAVDSAAPDNFRLNLWKLEPGCYPALRFLADTDRHIDIGDDPKSAHITVRDGAPFSIDQVLVPGKHTGYAVYDDFDTGTVNDDPDVDPNQTATNLEAPDGQDVDYDALVICVSDHEDSGQNEPYAHSDAPAGENEVYAKNRPVIQPTVATLGQGMLNGVARYYKMGFGYEVESWYDDVVINDAPAFSLDLTDPMGILLNSSNADAAHVRIPARIAGPRFDALGDGPGVLRVNDIDVAGEEFGNPHYERSDYGQTDVFNVNGDAKSFIEFGTEGDLPVTWSLKASLAATDTLRTVSFTPADFDEWMQAWQGWYCGTSAHPDLPLTPGTNSPDPRGECPVVNPPEAQPVPTPASPAPVVVQVPVPVGVPVAAGSPAAAVTPKAKAKRVTAKQRKAYKRCLTKAKKKHGKKARAKARAKCARMPH